MEAYERFVSMTTDPYWIVLATFISGFALGWLVCFATSACESLFRFFPLLLDKFKEAN